MPWGGKLCVGFGEGLDVGEVEHVGEYVMPGSTQKFVCS